MYTQKQQMKPRTMVKGHLPIASSLSASGSPAVILANAPDVPARNAIYACEQCKILSGITPAFLIFIFANAPQHFPNCRAEKQKPAQRQQREEAHNLKCYVGEFVH
jgi:hypothetical protein